MKHLRKELEDLNARVTGLEVLVKNLESSNSSPEKPRKIKTSKGD